MPAYSNLFSSGLLAPGMNTVSPSRPHTPAPPSSPIVLPTTPGDPIDCDITLDPSYTDHMLISPGPTTNKDIHTNTTEHRPRLRKRRSSLSISTSPMAGIKSPGRNAGNALHRTGLLSPSRSSMGNMNDFHQHGLSVATEGTSLTGRIRGGSLGGALRSRRIIRKSSGPAPTAPLPPLPPSSSLPPIPSSAPTFQCSFPQSRSLLPQPQLTYAAPNPRRPLAHRFNHLTSQSQSNLQNPNLSLTSPDFTATSLLKAMNTPPASSLEGGGGALGAPFQFAGDEYRIDENMKEN